MSIKSRINGFEPELHTIQDIVLIELDKFFVYYHGLINIHDQNECFEIKKCKNVKIYS